MRKRTGADNPNWKGGLTKFKSADGLLGMPAEVQEEIHRRILRQVHKPRGSTCWIWVGKTFPNGRAMLVLGPNNFTAATLVYALWKGRIDGLWVLHTCDNPLCVNPEHLWLGTASDNSADMVRKGRSARGDRNGSRLHPERLVRGESHPVRKNPRRVQGERNGRALLTDEQVREIRRRYVPYVNNHKPSNQRELAEEFGVQPHVIALIGKGKTWRSIK